MDTRRIAFKASEISSEIGNFSSNLTCVVVLWVVKDAVLCGDVGETGGVMTWRHGGQAMCRAVRHTTVVLAHVRILNSLPHGRYLLRSVVKVVLERKIKGYWIDRYLFKYYSLVVVIIWKYRHITINWRWKYIFIRRKQLYWWKLPIDDSSQIE